MIDKIRFSIMGILAGVILYGFIVLTTFNVNQDQMNFGFIFGMAFYLPMIAIGLPCLIGALLDNMLNRD